jgi:hypothetical protein
MAALFEEEITKYPVSPPVAAALESFVHVVIALWYPSPFALSFFSFLHLSLCLSFRLLVLRAASRGARETRGVTSPKNKVQGFTLYYVAERYACLTFGPSTTWSTINYDENAHCFLLKIYPENLFRGSTRESIRLGGNRPEILIISYRFIIVVFVTLRKLDRRVAPEPGTVEDTFLQEREGEKRAESRLASLAVVAACRETGI